MTKQKTIKEEVLKEIFTIMPFPEADNLKHIRKSANRILETKDLSLPNLEKAIDLTLSKFASLLKDELACCEDSEFIFVTIDGLAGAKSVEDKR